MAVEKNCRTCRYGLKPMSFPECLTEKCDENYSNWTEDTEDKAEAVHMDQASGALDIPS
jgi:hypothetical protein